MDLGKKNGMARARVMSFFARQTDSSLIVEVGGESVYCLRKQRWVNLKKEKEKNGG